MSCSASCITTKSKKKNYKSSKLIRFYYYLLLSIFTRILHLFDWRRFENNESGANRKCQVCAVAIVGILPPLDIKI
uniref:Uncharacterized protein n=1 Tax=Anguilla anguilla TaxID=7936 RepID=A0A0E9RC79_ANGAN